MAKVRRVNGDVHIRSIEGDVRPIAAFGTSSEKHVVKTVREQTMKKLSKKST